MLDNYRNNLKYAYKMLYPGSKYTLFLLVPTIGIVVVLYIIARSVGIAWAEVKFLTTLMISAFVVMVLPFLLVTGYSLAIGFRETSIESNEYVKRVIKMLPYLGGFIVFIVIAFLLISLIFQQLGIPFFK